MSSYSLYKSRERSRLLVMWVLIGLFIVAWALMFIHPTGAIAIFWLGLAVVLFAALADRLARRAELRQAGREHAPTRCPRCGPGTELVPEAPGEWRCAGCGESVAADQPAP